MKWGGGSNQWRLDTQNGNYLTDHEQLGVRSHRREDGLWENWGMGSRGQLGNGQNRLNSWPSSRSVHVLPITRVIVPFVWFFSLEYPLPLSLQCPGPQGHAPSPGPRSSAASCMRPSWFSFPTPAGNGLSPDAVGWAPGGKYQSWSGQECWGLWDPLALGWTRWEGSRAVIFFSGLGLVADILEISE